MSDSGAVKLLADEIREAYRSDPGNADAAIEMKVAANCTGMSDDQKRAFLSALISDFEPLVAAGNPVSPEDSLPKNVISLLLGKEVLPNDISSSEMFERLSVALNTLFSTLNRIVKTIDETLMMKETGDQTIRSLIGSQMDETYGGQSIDDYLGRIEKAFLVSHQAFRQAAHTIFRKILDEVNPDTITASTESRFKFGAIRKAESFDIFETKFVTLKSWFESGRFMKDFLREFENNCRLSP